VRRGAQPRGAAADDDQLKCHGLPRTSAPDT
jgi:hypothetical protein